MDTDKKIPTTRPVHYEDDFDFVLHLYSVLVDPEGNVTRREELPFPKYDFTATFRTGCTARSFTASCIGGVCTNCYNDAGRVHVVADNHGLGPGPLRCKLTCELPDEVFPDGTRRMVVPENLNIELTIEKGAYPSTLEAEVLLPYIKGDKGDAFTYSDFTPEQIEELQRPATEAARRADESEAVRQANEEQRVKSETDRSTAYKEIARAEDARESAERLRSSAEERRTDSEGLRAGAEDDREAEETVRQSHEEDRTAQEESRQMAETRREEAEAARQRAFEEAQTQRAADFSEAEGRRDAEFATYSDAIEVAKRKVFVDLWNAACGPHGKYDLVNAPDAEHPFYLNELWLTYEEAVEIMQLPRLRADSGDSNSNRSSSNEWLYANKYYIRTHLPKMAYDRETKCRYTFLNCRSIEVVDDLITPLELCFRDCVKLRKVNIWQLFGSNSPEGYCAFENCRSLTDIYVKTMGKFDCLLKWSPLITKESFSRIITATPQNVVTGGGYTITVHPDVYAKLTGDTSNEAAAALDAEEAAEWQAVLTAAAAKNISFATV